MRSSWQPSIRSARAARGWLTGWCALFICGPVACAAGSGEPAVIWVVLPPAPSAEPNLDLADHEPRRAGLRSCDRDVRIGALQMSSPSCFVDSHVAGQSGVFQRECEDTSAQIVIGEIAFVGRLNGDSIDLSTTSSYDFKDGCHWTTTQRIAGRIEGGAVMYIYGESAVPIQGNHSCATPCTASAQVQVGPAANARPFAR